VRKSPRNRPTRVHGNVEATLRRAIELHGTGETAGAEALYLQVLRIQPRNAAALHMLGVLATQSGNAPRALELIGQSLALDPKQAGAHSNLGHALMGLGRHAEAVDCFDRALALKPGFAAALINRGVCLIHLGAFQRAVDSLSRALGEVPQGAEIYFNRGVALAGLARFDEAIADYEAAIQVRPDYTEAAFNRAVLLATLGRTTAAIDGYDRVLLLRPDHAEALNNRALALIQLGRFEESLATINRALLLAPTLADAHNNRGLALRHLRDLDGALDSFDRALELRAEFAAALSNRGWVLLSLGRSAEALTSLDRALAIQPDFVEALTNRGVVLNSRERRREALECFERALAINPNCEDALSNLGILLIETHRYPEAIACLRRLIALAPRHEYALGNLLEAQLRCCDWSEYTPRLAEITAAVTRGQNAIKPFFMLALADDPALQLACSRLYGEHHFPRREMPSFAPRRQSARRIRLAYVSGDLRDHAVTYLAAGLFEQHDREHFEVIAISMRPAHDSAIGHRVRTGVDEFIDVSSLSDALIVSRMRGLGVDIAIDLSGYTGVGRPGIFVQRAAPLQVNYLGFPATMGLNCMDYIIGDEFLIPETSRGHYAECVVYLPNCFQVNDHRRDSGVGTPSRRDSGLPERGIVLCSFSNGYKLNPELFGVWLRLLAARADAVLWLVGDNECLENNLRRVAVSQGIAPERLIFARMRPYAEHLARLRLADLCLDTLPFNGGTTASDALWAGVPILTCAGSGFAARMAGSLLRTIGLPDLVTHTIGDYESLALRLMSDPLLLAGYRATLAANRSTAPLFDTVRSCRDIESGFRSMWQRYVRGEAPASFEVSG
jgi:predicted O-linked N-acetylglucosamine transferase (SPINDLY family)